MILFESERLYVQPYTSADAGIFFQLNGNTEIMRYIRRAKTKNESDQFLQENLALYNRNPGLGRFAVFAKKGQHFVGSFSLLSLDDTDYFHLGYALLKPFHGKGYATELVKASLSYVFKTIKKENILAITVKENIASQKVLLNCGFIQTGTRMHDGAEVMEYALQRVQYKANYKL